MVSMEIVAEWGGVLGLTRRHVRRIIEHSWVDRGKYWHQTYRERHFHPNAMTRYNYTPRSKKYNKRKRDDLKQTFPQPLVFSGVSRDRSKTGRAEGSQNGVKVVMPVQAFNFRPKTRSGRVPPNMREEFTRIIPEEMDTMDRRQTAYLERGFEAAVKLKEAYG